MRHGAGQKHLSRTFAAEVDGVIVAPAADQALLNPAVSAGQHRCVTSVAVDDQLAHGLSRRKAVAAARPAQRCGVGAVDQVHAGDVDHILHRQIDGVVAAAAQVYAFYRFQARAAAKASAALVGDQRQIQREACAVKRQGVDAAAAIDPGQLRAVAAGTQPRLQCGDSAALDDDAVIARTAQQHISPAKARQGVMAGTAHQNLAQAGAAQAVVAHSAQDVNLGQHKGAAGGAEDDIAAPCTGASGGVTQVGAHHQVGQAVAVDIAGCGHADAAAIAGALPVDDKAAAAVGHRTEVHRRRARLAEHQVAATCIGACAGITRLGTHNQVGQAVAVDITGTGYAPTAVVAAGATVDHEAARACGHHAELHGCTAALAEHDIAAPRVGTGCGVAVGRADDQVGQAVAVDIAGTSHTPAAVVTGTLPIDDKAARPAGHRAEVDGRARRGAKHHVAAARIGPGRGARVAVRSAHNQVGQAVTVDVACAGHAVTALVQGALAVEDKAARSCGHRTELDRCAAAFAKDHIAAPGIDTGGRIAQVGADDQIGQAVAIDIARTRNAGAAGIAGALAVDHKATRARCHGAELDGGAAGLAKHHITASGIGAHGRARVAPKGANNQVSQTIAIDIARARHADAA